MKNLLKISFLFSLLFLVNGFCFGKITENAGRYEAGRLVVPVGSTVISIVGQVGKGSKISKTKTVLKGIEGLSESKADDLTRRLIQKGEDVGIIIRIIYKGVKYEDFIATVGDFAGGAKADLAKQAYKLWGEEKWVELYQYFKTNDLNEGWPPFNGAKSILKTEKETN